MKIICLLLLPSLALAQVPREAEKYQRELTRQTRLTWGLTAPIATFAAQIQQESSFNPNARSPSGALGLSQFMPETASWISGSYVTLAGNEPLNPTWAMRALGAYDKYLWDRTVAKTPCNRAAKMLAGYNGGLSWIARDEGRALREGLDSGYWWDNVELVNSGRGADTWRENRAYPRMILTVYEPRFVKAGWGMGLCTLEPKCLLC